MTEPTITLSVVSHGHGALVRDLLSSIEQHCGAALEVIVTRNIPEAPLHWESDAFPVRVIDNRCPQGFGANHNAAFQQSLGKYFCVINPDIRITHDPFPALIDALNQNPSAGVAGPRVETPCGKLEDSARRFPTPWSILLKLLGRNKDRQLLGEKLYQSPVTVDWIAGMFMLFPREVFEQLGGFDERYFLYYEDVDLCSRLHRNNRRVLVVPNAAVIHDARRESHRNLKFLRWHLASMMRFFIRHNLGKLLGTSSP